MSEVEPKEGVVSATSDEAGIRIVEIFDALRELVFKAWTEPERFAGWFGEDGSSVPLETVSMDVRPGGAWNLIMLFGPDRAELPFSGHYLEIVEPERLVMTITDQVHPDGEDVEVVTVVLEDLGDGRTRMTFTQHGGNLDADGYAGARRGWLAFFERTGTQLKARHDAR